MDDFKIELDIPIARGRANSLSHALRQLCQSPDGASILFSDQNCESIRVMVCRLANEQKVKLTARKVDGGVRVWKLP